MEALLYYRIEALVHIDFTLCLRNISSYALCSPLTAGCILGQCQVYVLVMSNWLSAALLWVVSQYLIYHQIRGLLHWTQLVLQVYIIKCVHSDAHSFYDNATPVLYKFSCENLSNVDPIFVLDTTYSVPIPIMTSLIDLQQIETHRIFRKMPLTWFFQFVSPRFQVIENFWACVLCMLKI